MSCFKNSGTFLNILLSILRFSISQLGLLIISSLNCTVLFQISFDLSEYTAEVDGLGTLRLLDAVRTAGLEDSVKLYQASTSEMYGKVVETPQKETTPFYPRSPYGKQRNTSSYSSTIFSVSEKGPSHFLKITPTMSRKLNCFNSKNHKIFNTWVLKFCFQLSKKTNNKFEHYKTRSQWLHEYY